MPRRRYASRASLAALGVLDQPNEEEQRLFETVVQRNAINHHAPRQAAGVGVLAAPTAPSGCGPRLRDSYPLYVDGLPAPLVRVLEKLTPWGTNVSAGPVAAAAPRPQNVTALGMCRVFARKAGLGWARGLAVGAGGAIAGRLEGRGGLARYLVRALDLAAAFLAEEKDIPAEAVALAARPPVPGFALVYRAIANSEWRAAAKANGVAGKLFDQPYRRED